MGRSQMRDWCRESIAPDCASLHAGYAAYKDRLARDHLCEQLPVTFDRLADRQAQLHLPAARRHWVDDRHAEILLQQIDDWQHPPAGAEQIDRVGLAVLEEGLLDVGIDLFGR